MAKGRKEKNSGNDVCKYCDGTGDGKFRTFRVRSSGDDSTCQLFVCKKCFSAGQYDKCVMCQKREGKKNRTGACEACRSSITVGHRGNPAGENTASTAETSASPLHRKKRGFPSGDAGRPPKRVALDKGENTPSPGYPKDGAGSSHSPWGTTPVKATTSPATKKATPDRKRFGSSGNTTPEKKVPSKAVGSREKRSPAVRAGRPGTRGRPRKAKVPSDTVEQRQEDAVMEDLQVEDPSANGSGALVREDVEASGTDHGRAAVPGTRVLLPEERCLLKKTEELIANTRRVEEMYLELKDNLYLLEDSFWLAKFRRAAERDNILILQDIQKASKTLCDKAFQK